MMAGFTSIEAERLSFTRQISVADLITTKWKVWKMFRMPSKP
jgi:hypothetical protein